MTFKEAVLKGCELVPKKKQGGGLQNAEVGCCVLGAALLGAGVADLRGNYYGGAHGFHINYGRLVDVFPVLNHALPEQDFIRVFTWAYEMNDSTELSREKIADMVDALEQALYGQNNRI